MVKFTPIEAGVIYRHDYPAIFAAIAAGKKEGLATYRQLCKEDLFFLLYFGLERVDVNDPFVIECIQEVEDDLDDTLDLWAREHYKSTIITYGRPIQDVLKNPEERIAIFSHTRPIAKGFLRQIKQTLENTDLPVVKWFPDIFFKKPKTQAPKWSEDDGLIVKRKSNSKEATFEAWGMVDGQPTSKHFTRRIYDDVVTKESVTTPEQIKKVLDAYETSESLGTDGGTSCMAGTHYHFADLYSHRRKTMPQNKVRIKPATDDGTPQGNPVFLSHKRLAELRVKQGSYVFACQQLLNPVASEDQRFQADWLKYYDRVPARLNKYLLGDPSNEKSKQSDYTSLGVIGLDAYGNYFLLDLLREKLSLGERWDAIRNMWSANQPIKATGYEKYGKDADINYFEEKQRDQGIYFPITALGGPMSKVDRILRLVPRFESGTFLLPRRLIRNGEDLIQIFIDEEYLFFPFTAHDDLLDMIARIEDIGAVRPMAAVQEGQVRAITEYDVLRAA